MSNLSLDLLRKKHRKPIANTSPAAPGGGHSPLPGAAIQRAQQNPQSLASHEVINLQRSMGNRAVNDLVRGTSNGVPSLQTKPEVGPAHDKYEDEAEQVAGQVIRRQSATPVGDKGGSAPAQVEQGIQAARGGGASLPEGVRRSLEGTMGADFGGVRVHTDQLADTLNRSLSARAFTTGQDVFFKKGEYSPGSSEGRGLLAHELTHVVQQSGGNLSNAQRSPMIQRFSDEDTKRGAHTDWNGETAQVTKSSVGQVGGVFFARDGNGTQLVIKPEYHDNEVRPTTAGQSQFADKVLGKFGFETPGSRIVKSGTPEFQQIIQVVSSGRLQLDENDEPKRNEIGERLARAKYVKVMSKVQGSSWQSKIDDSVLSQQNADQFLNFVVANNYALPRNMGKLAVADASMGNDDRIGFTKSWGGRMYINAGNVMFVDDKMTMIDSDASIGSLVNLKGVSTGAFEVKKQDSDPISYLTENMDAMANSFATFHIKDKLETARGKFRPNIQNGFNIDAYYAEWLPQHKDAIAASFKAGMQAGITQLSTLLANREQMQDLHQGVREEGEGEEEGIWSTFKARSRYILDRDQGTDKDVAHDKAQLYFESKLTNGQGSHLDAEEVDPTALNVEAPRKKSKFSLKRKFGKRKKSRKLRDQARRYMRDNDTLLNLDEVSGFTNKYNLQGANKALGSDVLKSNRNDRAGREINFLQNAGVLLRELRKKEEEIRNHTARLNLAANYLRFAQGNNSKEREMARKRIHSFIDRNLITKLQLQVDQLRASADRAVPGLQKHNRDLGGKIRDVAAVMEQLMTTLGETSQGAWNTFAETGGLEN